MCIIINTPVAHVWGLEFRCSLSLYVTVSENEVKNLKENKWRGIRKSLKRGKRR